MYNNNNLNNESQTTYHTSLGNKWKTNYTHFSVTTGLYVPNDEEKLENKFVRAFNINNLLNYSSIEKLIQMKTYFVEFNNINIFKYQPLQRNRYLFLTH